MNTQKLTNIVRITALVLNVAAILFIGTFLLGHLFGEEDNFNAITNSEIVMLVFFPGLTLAGMLLALKKHLAGGLLTVFSIVAFHLVRPELNISLIDLMAVPGLLFVVWYILSRRK